MSSRPPSRRRAVSFVEIAFAVLILGLAVGPILGLFSSLSTGTTGSIYEMVAAQYAAELLEQVRLLPLPTILGTVGATSLADLRPTLAIPNAPATVSKVELVPGVFLLASPMPTPIFTSRTLFLEKETTTVGPTPVHLLRARVVVTWEARGGGPRQFTACTYVMEP